MKKLGVVLVILSCMAAGCKLTGDQLKQVVQSGAAFVGTVVEVGPKMYKDGEAFVNACTGKTNTVTEAK